MSNDLVSQVPSFASESWYSDPSDHRRPHDAWLESCEVRELGQGKRNEIRTTAITVRLLGAYHDGHIVLRYSDVEKFVFSSEAVAGGLRDWLSDQFAVTANGLIRHEITWAGTQQTGRWSIDAHKIEYEWIPNST
jgi:hypothetical protein